MWGSPLKNRTQFNVFTGFHLLDQEWKQYLFVGKQKEKMAMCVGGTEKILDVVPFGFAWLRTYWQKLARNSASSMGLSHLECFPRWLCFISSSHQYSKSHPDTVLSDTPTLFATSLFTATDFEENATSFCDKISAILSLYKKSAWAFFVLMSISS